MSSTRIPVPLTLLALATAGLLVVAGSASADKPKPVNVSATLTYTAPSTFSGKVSSKADACEKAAPITLNYYVSSSDTTADALFTGKANKKGFFSLTLPSPAIAGEYQLNVGGRKVHEPNGDIDKCRVLIGLRHEF